MKKPPRKRTLVMDDGRELQGLEDIALHLNMIPGMDEDRAKAWRRVEEIVQLAIFDPARPTLHPLLGGGPRTGSITAAAGVFNKWASAIPVRLKVRWREEKGGAVHIQPQIDTEGETGFVVWMVWRVFFYAKRWNRLKRCPQCRKWFVDRTRNAVMARCSKSCTDKWWTLERRREAGHKVPGSARYAKRRAKR